ncbi:MAG: DUF853 family protein [Lachnospiraceae bacterium]|nr:DUF853 family protein [Lachnospiraceae bacterium]
MYLDGKIYVGNDNGEQVFLLPKMANRHGLIAGATGTGKTVTLKVLAESFSAAGVPVFFADVKGDLSGTVLPGSETEKIAESIANFGLLEHGFDFKGFPAVYWDVYGEYGLPLRTTISEMGPLLLSRILDLNATQEGVLSSVFRIADDEGLLLIDTKDLRAMLQYVSEHTSEYTSQYGNMSKQSLGAILRNVLKLEDEGGDLFFGEPALSIADWIARDVDGRGMINILDSRKLVQSPTMYSTFLLWMLSELYELLPEVGDMDKPRLVFFFDEAHLLFDSASKNLKEKVEQVVKLIRSKGVGIYFATQNPSDIPGPVLSQLGNKFQHALHAYTPAEKKGIKAAADSFRENPAFKTTEVIEELGIGEALISVLDEDGVPTIVKKAKILPPESALGAVSEEQRRQKIQESFLYPKYAEGIDRDSAYEMLERITRQETEAKEKAKAEAEAEKQRLKEEAAAEKQRLKEEADAEKQRLREEAAAAKQKEREEKAAAAQKAKQDRKVKSAVQSAASSAAGTVGREIGKTAGSTIGGKFGKTIGGNVGASLGRGLLKTLFRS